MTTDGSPQPDLLTLSKLGQKDRIQILLSEYSTLRAEIISRTTNGFTLTTIGVTVLTWVIKEFTSTSPWYYWLGAITLMIVFGLGVFVNVRDITRAARRVKSLEHEINSRSGEHLLIWETLSGVATRMGIFRSFFCNVKPLPRSQLPPLDTYFLAKDGKRSDSDFEHDSDPSHEYSLRLCPAQFWLIVAIGVAFVGIQGVCAYFDGYFSQAQIIEVHDIRNAYAFLEHGGMWTDVFVVTPIVAYIMIRYRLPYFSGSGILILIVAVVVCFVAGNIYQDMGKTLPEAHTHFGHTPLAGWIHGVYAIMAIWICAMFYLTHVEPQPAYDMIAISIGLTAHTVFGVVKFNPKWSWSTGAIIQVAVFIALIWVMTAYKIGRYREKIHGSEARLNYLSILILLGVFIAGNSYAYDRSFAIKTTSVNIPPGADIAGMGNAWTATPNFSSNNPAVIAAGDNYKYSGSATYGLIGFKNNKSINIYSVSASARLPAGTVQAGYSYSSSGRLATKEGDEMKLSAPMSVDVMYGFNAANYIFREGDRLFAGIGYGNSLSKLTFSTNGADVATSRSRGNTYSAGVLYSPGSGLNVAAYYAHGREKNKDNDTTEDVTMYSTSNTNTARIGLSWLALPETLMALDYQHLESDGQKKDQIFVGIEQSIIKDTLYIYSGWAGSGPTIGVGLYFKRGGINIAYMHNQFDDLSDYLGKVRFCMLTGYLSF